MTGESRGKTGHGPGAVLELGEVLPEVAHGAPGRRQVRLHLGVPAEVEEGGRHQSWTARSVFFSGRLLLT